MTSAPCRLVVAAERGPELEQDRSVLWWIVPLIVAAPGAGSGLQMFFTYLWIIGKGHFR